MRARSVPAPPVRPATDHLFGGRWSLETNTRWVYPAHAHGLAAENISQNGGTGPDPDLAWSAQGIPIRAQEVVSGLLLMGRTNSAEVTGVEMRLYHQTGDWEGSWNDASGSVLTLVAQQVGLFPTPAKRRSHLALSYTAPQDGVLIPTLKPSGSLTGRRYLFMTGFVEILKKPL